MARNNRARAAGSVAFSKLLNVRDGAFEPDIPAYLVFLPMIRYPDCMCTETVLWASQRPHRAALGRRLVSRLLVHFSTFHYKINLLEQADVVQRIALHCYHISKFSRSDASHVVLHSQHLRSSRGR